MPPNPTGGCAAQTARLHLNHTPPVRPVDVRVGVVRFDVFGHPRSVLLVHGDPEARAWMAEHIEEAHPETDVHRPDWGSVIEV